METRGIKNLLLVGYAAAMLESLRGRTTSLTPGATINLMVAEAQAGIGA